MSQTNTFKYSSSVYTTEEIVGGIIENRDEVIRYIYNNYFISIKKMVFTFRNITLEPEEIFQEGLTRAMMNIQSGKFRGDSSFITYLNSICRNICRKQLNNKNYAVELHENIEDKIEDNRFELLELVCKLKNNIGEKCRSIIDLRFKTTHTELGDTNNKLMPFEEIAITLGIGVANARKRFGRCLENLRNTVMKDPVIKTFFE
jgi:RNA polymerase sigma factor (sigma-70 family)